MDNRDDCQYCEDIGPCRFCPRGQKQMQEETEKMKKMKKSRKDFSSYSSNA